ncbi:protein-L-isoaspartate(D-aspartate) O-methyltransferase [bacterium]|nr:protein-L-isoaspartate(D-aspartate) O-methyltransferase [bacterium]
MKVKTFIPLLFIIPALFLSCNPNKDKDPYAEVKDFMIDVHLKGRGIKDTAVLEAMRRVKREEFVPFIIRNKAYQDNPLPIGQGQVISQPYIAAFMTEALQLKPDDKVLEIGTGSGYHAAVMAEIAKKVYTIEILESLAKKSEKLLNELGYKNIHVRAGDGYVGWPEVAPFDKILLTASPPKIPQPLIDQLKDGGILVSPVDIEDSQMLIRGIKKDGKLVTENLLDVRFVPMIGKIRE